MTSKRTKGITVRLSEKEYQKVEQLAEERHMNPTEYTRHMALGNRIKPTIIKTEVAQGVDETLKEHAQNVIHYLQIGYERDYFELKNGGIQAIKALYDYLQTIEH